MFDIGFTELMLIALVGLIVIGPERLPSVARTLGHMLGRLQRYVSDVKADISREIQIEELKKLEAEVSAQAREVEQTVNDRMREIEASLNKAIVPPTDATDTTPAPALTAETSPAVATQAEKTA